MNTAAAAAPARRQLRITARRRDDIAARLASLTERERQVMELAVAGKVNKEIAAAFGLSKKTVDVHRAHVMQKLQVETLAELVQLVVTARLPVASETMP